MSYSPITQSGTVTSFLPLTTAWPATKLCSSVFYTGGGFDNPVAFYPDLHLYYANVGTAPNCLPPEVATWWYQDTGVSSVATVLAPIVCPEQYYTIVADKESNDDSTFVACCPS